MNKYSFLTAALWAAAAGAQAQPAPANVRGQLQQIPPAPTQPRAIPDLRIERGQAPAAQGPAGARFAVGELRITGATLFTESELVEAAQFHPGADTDLAGLRAMAARITEFYARRGYFVAQAYVPAQDVAGGAVTIAVIEGRYGKVALRNESRVSDRLARSILAGLDSGDPVATVPLERRLLLLSDLPGVKVQSTLAPGEAVGASDLLVDLQPGRRISGSLEADNGGNRYTGAYRAGGTINFNELIGQGDVASLRALSAGSGLTYLRGAYQAQVGSLTVGAAYTHLDYELGKEFKPLGAHGTARIASLYGSYPVVRSRDANLYALAGFDAKAFKDEVDTTGTATKRTARVASLGLAGDLHDRLGGGGWSSYSLSWSQGDLDIKTPTARAIDAVTARTSGAYGKLSFQAARLQQLTDTLSLNAQVRGQLASKNLDSSEKMELGGPFGVRAYPEGEAYGDEGYIATAEARLSLAAISEGLHQLQAVAFADYGSITLNKTPWMAGRNHRNLSAVGVGLTWSDRRNLVAKISYAFKLGDQPAQSAPDRSGRLWVQVSKFF
ncbi:ShlB/FhaC/HecB family hemolysin secretion/activation protein [Phenylobacterium immobile]|uniref:ShlB/FhaC/HecB family hemolysin secretion/activation protein n=1 Tax=Phenylobacterium immobile TaxID=21 RepID=UPI000B000CBA|nr:ShlB/FhaC/HecB family hemolysin secretion/activation protein [Phenylobacterium immobile]